MSVVSVCFFKQKTADEMRISDWSSDVCSSDSHRLAWARARAKWTLGRNDEAEAILAGLDAEGVPFDVRANATAARASVLDRLGRRQEALEAYAGAQAYLEANPEYNDGLISPLRKIGRAHV